MAKRKKTQSIFDISKPEPTPITKEDLVELLEQRAPEARAARDATVKERIKDLLEDSAIAVGMLALSAAEARLVTERVGIVASSVDTAEEWEEERSKLRAEIGRTISLAKAAKDAEIAESRGSKILPYLERFEDCFPASERHQLASEIRHTARMTVDNEAAWIEACVNNFLLRILSAVKRSPAWILPGEAVRQRNFPSLVASGYQRFFNWLDLDES